MSRQLPLGFRQQLREITWLEIGTGTGYPFVNGCKLYSALRLFALPFFLRDSAFCFRRGCDLH